jgi:formylglycine-generating enzyme required for sulfatase activity
LSATGSEQKQATTELDGKAESPVRPRPPRLASPFNATMARAGQESWAAYLNRPVELTNSLGMRFRLIPPGEFYMGASRGTAIFSDSECPRHKVEITRPFYFGVTPLTQGDYQILMGVNPSHFRGNQLLPVEKISWDDAQDFLAVLRKKAGDGRYRLPTEAEWEYACRAGTTTSFWFGNELNGQQANCDGGRSFGTTTKGPFLAQTSTGTEYPANPFGLYAVHGNVWEWCQDWYAANYYEQFGEQAAIDPKGPESGTLRCLRGGSWYDGAAYCTSHSRWSENPHVRSNLIGLRVVLEL